MWAREGRHPPDVGSFGSRELYSSRRQLASWVCLSLGWGGEEAAGTGGGGTAISWVSLLPQLQSLQWILGSNSSTPPHPPPLTWSLRLTFSLTLVGDAGGGDQVLTSPQPPPRGLEAQQARSPWWLMSGAQNENKMWWRKAICNLRVGVKTLSVGTQSGVPPFSTVLYSVGCLRLAWGV